jgi:hypothetical protein
MPITILVSSTLEKPVYAARNDRICLNLRQVLADEVAQNMTGRHFQKKLTA